MECIFYSQLKEMKINVPGAMKKDLMGWSPILCVLMPSCNAFITLYCNFLSVVL